MAGKLCPNCGNQTLFATSTGRKCTKCGYEIVVPTNGGKVEKGESAQFAENTHCMVLSAQTHSVVLKPI